VPLSQWMAPWVARLSWWGVCAIILSGANDCKQFQVPSRDYEAFHSKDVTVSQFVDTFEFSQLSNAKSY